MGKTWFLENRRWIKEILMYMAILLIAVGILYGIDGGNAYLYIDSQYYLTLSVGDGIMPVYPLLIYAVRKIVGESTLLSALVLIQCIWAFVCVFVTTIYIRKKFTLNHIETIIVNLLLYLPFLSSLPECVVSHQVLTEALTYPLMYIFIILAYETVLSGRLGTIAALFCCAIILHLTKTMMIWVYFPLLILVIWKIWRIKQKALLRFAFMGTSCVVAMILVFVTLKVQGLYFEFVPYLLSADKITDSITETEDSTNTQQIDLSRNIGTSQFENLIEIKGWTVLNAKTVEKLTGENREIAMLVYEELSKNGMLLESNTSSWRDGWEGLTHDQIVSCANNVIKAYYNDGSNDNQQISSLVRMKALELSIRSIVCNFGGFVYLCARLVIPGFMASIFFQNTKYYMLCMIISALLIVISIALLWYNRKSGDNEYRLLSMLVLFIGVQSVLISLVHIPLQRYLVYFQGMYYIALYMLLKRMKIRFVEKYDRNGITENS